MRKTSIRTPHRRTSELVREAAAGETIIIENRSHPVAELRPLSKEAKRAPVPDMSRVWNEFPQLTGDTSALISEDRDRS